MIYAIQHTIKYHRSDENGFENQAGPSTYEA